MKKIVISTLVVLVAFACGTSKTDSKNSTAKTEKSSKSSKTGDIKTNEADLTEEAAPEIIERDHYNPSATILTDLIHTKLEVSFDWPKSQLNGIAHITASPYFYDTDSIILDAKAMAIHSVTLGDKELDFKYNDGKFLRIGLDRTYNREEEYTIVIDYTAKPEEKALGGSSAISSDKGLYFINPTGEDPNRMPQIWTQGETEASSVWFPTIDRPNQKMSQEIFITVEDKYKTLSNGKLVSSKHSEDGKYRTDHWKQELPHVPYLAAMAVGEFSIVEDEYIRPDGSKMPVYYYVEPEWEEHAKAIFGVTPKMIGFFSELLGVEYPWDKYHQVVVRDYVSGAMENTGAVIFGDFVYKTKRELLDGNSYSIIAHELFHHWFGDLVTCESWANLPLNESFANYSQYLWDEHYYGVDEADHNAEQEAKGYYQSAMQAGHHDMIWYDYEEKEDMFDGHSYNKGGRILHMLRKYLGDDAFFESLRLYLETHQYKPVEIHHLRLAFEEVSGEDLNWFFDQWFFGSRHPELNVEMDTTTSNKVVLTIEQTQDLEKAPLYKLPLKVAVYENETKTTHEIVVDKNINEFTFEYSGQLKNIVVDEDRALLGTIKFKKPSEHYVHQFYNAPRYKDRVDGLTYGSRDKNKGQQLIFDALDDDFWYIKNLAIGKLNKVKRNQPEEVYEQLKKMIANDDNSSVRATALKYIADEFFDDEYEEPTRQILLNSIESDSSYYAVSKALSGLTKGNDEDIKKAISLADELRDEKSSVLRAQIAQIYSIHGGPEHIAYFTTSLREGHVSGYEAIGVMGSLSSLLKRQDIKIQQENLSFYEEMAKGSNPYINAVLPMNLMMLKRDADSAVGNLSSEIESLKESGKEDEVAKKQVELEETKDFVKNLNKLISELAR